MRFCSSVPGGHLFYTLLQKQFGNLNDDPWSRVTMQQEMVQWLAGAGISIPGKVFFEVGTGHKPVIPVCFSLMGTDGFITVDLNRRMDLKLLKGVLNNLANERAVLIANWKNFIPEDILRQRFDMLNLHKDDPELFLQKGGIQYLAPRDAGSTHLSDESIDCHLSSTVMEHIPPDVLLKILKESYRLLKRGGAALHFIDLSDHFQHQDSSISEINFLRYSDREWDRIAGNEYAYTNRLRVPDYLSLFKEVPFNIMRLEVSQGNKEQFNGDVLLDPQFNKYSQEDISAIELRILLMKP